MHLERYISRIIMSGETNVATGIWWCLGDYYERQQVVCYSTVPYNPMRHRAGHQKRSWNFLQYQYDFTSLNSDVGCEIWHIRNTFLLDILFLTVSGGCTADVLFLFIFVIVICINFCSLLFHIFFSIIGPSSCTLTPQGLEGQRK